MDDNEAEMRKLTLKEVRDATQDCKTTDDTTYVNDVVAPSNAIRNADCYENVLSRTTQIPLNGDVNGNRSSGEAKRSREKSLDLLEGDFPESSRCDHTISQKSININTEEVVVHQRNLLTADNGDFSKLHAINETANIPAQSGENLTFSKNSEDGSAREGQSNLEIERCSQRTNSINLSKDSQNALLTVQSPDTSGGNEKYTDGPNFSEHGVLQQENNENCDFTSEENAEMKTAPIVADIEDCNFEDQYRDSMIQDLSCSICIHELEVIRRSHQKYVNERPTKEVQTGSETDFIRPTSAASTSNTSCTSTNISDEIDPKHKSKKEQAVELNPTIISRRQKQIDYGKNTIGYERYKEMVPRHKRTKHDPQTPPKCLVYSRRGWDGLIRSWRRKLHDWDPPKQECEASDDEHSSLMSSSSIPTLSDDSEKLMDIATEPATKFLLTDDVEINGASDDGINMT